MLYSHLCASISQDLMFTINIFKICKNFASIFSFKGYDNSTDFLFIFLNRRVHLKITFEATCPFELLTAFYEHCNISVITNIFFLKIDAV